MGFTDKFFSKVTRKPLGSFDSFYNNIVSQLSMEAREQYCINLIGRLKEDLKQCNCPEASRNLEQYIRAANTELGKLRE